MVASARLKGLVVLSGVLALALALLALALNHGARLGSGVDRRAAAEGRGAAVSLSARRWSPESVVVAKPGLSVHEARSIHSMAQQKRWSRLFGSGGGSRGGPVDDPSLSAVSRSGKARLGMALHNAAVLASRQAGGSGGAGRETMLSQGHGWMTDSGDWANEADADHPVDWPMHQVYEYIARPHGGTMSVQEGARAWRDLQRGYQSQHPSMSTYPAVPVVFDDDDSGGHAEGVSPFGGSRRAVRGGQRLAERRGGQGPVELLGGVSSGAFFPDSAVVKEAEDGQDAASASAAHVAAVLDGASSVRVAKKRRSGGGG